MSKYAVRVTLEMITDGEVNGRTVAEDFSDNLAVHGVKAVAIARKLGKALPDAQEELFAMAVAATKGK